MTFAAECVAGPSAARRPMTPSGIAVTAPFSAQSSRRNAAGPRASRATSLNRRSSLTSNDSWQTRAIFSPSLLWKLRTRSSAGPYGKSESAGKRPWLNATGSETGCSLSTRTASSPARSSRSPCGQSRRLGRRCSRASRRFKQTRLPSTRIHCPPISWKISGDDFRKASRTRSAKRSSGFWFARSPFTPPWALRATRPSAR